MRSHGQDQDCGKAAKKTAAKKTAAKKAVAKKTAAKPAQEPAEPRHAQPRPPRSLLLVLTKAAADAEPEVDAPKARTRKTAAKKTAAKKAAAKKDGEIDADNPLAESVVNGAARQDRR